MADKGIPRIHSESELHKIQDLATAYEVMLQLSIDPAGVNDMSEALARIRSQFSKSTAEQIYRDQDRELKEAVEADVSNRRSLKSIFSQAKDYLQSLPPHFQNDLQHVFPDVHPTVDTTLQQLDKNECIIVVAGEKGAGKSSLVNLVAGCKILPVHMLNGTRTICELRHSGTRSFVLHPWDRRSRPVIRECRHENESSQFLHELAYHVTCVDEHTRKSPYEKIEINWPLPILGDGVTIVDSPGVGESRKVSQQLEDYMTRAFGFIYVINVSNAGGIHRDRLGQLLRQATERSNQGFDPSTALFVCNWWDQVPSRDQDHVMREMLSRLSRVWPGVRRQQVFPISSTESLRAVENGHILDEYRDLVRGIRRVLPRTFNAKLTTHYWWLSAVLKRSLYSLKIYSNIGRKEVAQKEAAFQNVRNQIEALESDAETQIDVMRDGFRREVDNITRRVLAFMKSDICLKEMRVWSREDCPSEKDIKKVTKDAASRFAEKLAAILDAWESQNALVGKVKANILKTFQRDLDLFEDQLKRLEGVLFQGMDDRIITDLHNSMRHQMPVKNVWKKARKDKAGPGGQGTEFGGCFSLGHAVCGCKTLDVKNTTVKNAFKSSSGPQAMATVSEIFLKQFKDEEVASAVKKFFERIAKRFDAASRLLPEFLKADRHLLKTLQGEMEGEKERQNNVYPQLLINGANLQGGLDMFFVERLMFFDFDMKDLKYNANESIGEGTFADVYSSSISSEDMTVRVALKIQRRKLTPKNVTDVLLEDRILRDIRHENIIRYHGAAREKLGDGLRWVMVLEYCTRTIKQRFLSEDANVPGRQQIVSLQLDAMREVALFASQICSALCYLHNKGIVHRDLKSDNILLTEDDVVKLTDVGLAKSVRDIAGTLAGTPVYMAPEVLLQKGQYDMKADVYSLAIILWELWYGQDAADHIESHLFQRLEDAVKAGLRPSLTQTIKPPEDWLELLQAGWELEASKRPSSRQVADFFEHFLARNKA